MSDLSPLDPQTVVLPVADDDVHPVEADLSPGQHAVQFHYPGHRYGRVGGLKCVFPSSGRVQDMTPTPPHKHARRTLHTVVVISRFAAIGLVTALWFSIGIKAAFMALLVLTALFATGGLYPTHSPRIPKRVPHRVLHLIARLVLTCLALALYFVIGGEAAIWPAAIIFILIQTGLL